MNNDLYCLSNMSDKGFWLECIPWDGNENALPSGLMISAPGVSIKELIKPNTKGLDTKIDEERFDTIVRAYGKRCIRIMDPSGKNLSRWEWKEAYGTDGLLLYAIRMNR
jgi:hypothetical protein